MTERKYEQQHLSETIKTITLENQVLTKQKTALEQTLQSGVKELTENKINTGNEEAFYESVLVYQEYEKDLQLKYRSADMIDKRLHTLATMKNSPYFARIDFTEGQEAAETLYLGIASLRDTTEEPVIVDWRAPIANLYYEGELGTTFYETDQDRFEVELLLKRQFKIQQGDLVSMVDTSEIINDEFLLDILDEASSSKMKNIVSTIQKSQNEIIRDTSHKNVLIEGIAGSGKTSALLQRVAFLLYHHRKWLHDEQVLLFSPNHLFSDYIAMVLPSLGESEVPTRTFKTFLHELLPHYQLLEEDDAEHAFLEGTINPIEQIKNGLSVIQEIPRYIRSITAVGPLFRDLKIKGKTYITKKQLRTWYQETNDLLPLYQRTQLLQAKVLKKLAGLERDEMKEKWLQDAAEEKMTEIFESDPNREYTEAKERALRKQVRQAIAKRKFRSMRRGIEAFQFINQPKQYVHFLQTIGAKICQHYSLDEMIWSEHLTTIKQQFRQKALYSEDILLLFLLTKQLYPVYVEQKARFIFIDEMQDFPPAQVALLKQLYPDAHITLCGDLNQKVFGNDTIVSELDHLFVDQEVKRYQLTTSYRSTEEITAFANGLLSQEETVQLTARNGEKPMILTRTATQQIAELSRLLKQDTPAHWRTAIICKTTKECQEIYAALSLAEQEQVQLIDTDETFMKKSIILIPCFLAKGLEFDRVIGMPISTNFATDQDRFVLYTLATRAMHELILLTDGTSPLLGSLDPHTYQ